MEYSQIVGDDLDKHLVDKLNQIFDFSLGRMQDIYYDTTGKVGVENMLDWIIENTPYTVYNESGVLIDDSQQVCLDSNGYLTVRTVFIKRLSKKFFFALLLQYTYYVF